MALYEMRTYTLHVGPMGETTKHYQERCYPALKKGGFDKHLVGYFRYRHALPARAHMELTAVRFGHAYAATRISWRASCPSSGHSSFQWR